MIKIAVVQQNASPNRQANLERGLKAIAAAKELGAHAVLLPELAFMPYFPHYRQKAEALDWAEPMDGPMATALTVKAAELEICVITGLFESEGHRAFNSAAVFDGKRGLAGVARQAHLPDRTNFYGKAYFEPSGPEPKVFETSAGRVGVLIGNDRHYPELTRTLAENDAQWIAIAHAGARDEFAEGLARAELRTAAFQNGYFLAMANRVGDENGLVFGGRSTVIGPDGVVITEAPDAEEGALYADLDFARVTESTARKQFLPSGGA